MVKRKRNITQNKIEKLIKCSIFSEVNHNLITARFSDLMQILYVRIVVM